MSFLVVLQVSIMVIILIVLEVSLIWMAQHLDRGELALGGGEVERRPAVVVTQGHVHALQGRQG